MTYYEELGVTPFASAGEIREAHHTLALLLHPDRQSPGRLRNAAELQMRRLNGLIEVLLDPRRRCAYDESLRPAGVVACPKHQDAMASDRPFWILDSIIAMLAALLVAFIAILVGVHAA